MQSRVRAWQPAGAAPAGPRDPYLSRSWAAGPHPRGLGTFPSCPGGGSRSSSPGSPCRGRKAPGRVDGGPRRAGPRPQAGPRTHSSDSRSCSSLLRSRKQPSECILSSTSGSMSSRLGSERICTLRGTGCSGSGSFLPPLRGQGPVTPSSRARGSSPAPRPWACVLLLSLRPASARLLRPACAQRGPARVPEGWPGALEAGGRPALGRALPPAVPSGPSGPQRQAKRAMRAGRATYIYHMCF